MKFKEIFLLLLLACMTCFSVTSCDKGNEQQQPQDDENTCTVTLVGDEHVNLPNNPTATIQKGESVSFTVTVDEGFVLTADRDDVEIKRRSITVSNVQDDITVTLTSNPAYRFTATTTNAVYGRVSASVNSGWVIANSDITLEAIANNGKKFIGWSKNYPMVDGGKIYSFDTSVSLKLNEDTTLYANFTNEENAIVVYDLGGGCLTDKPDAASYMCELKVDGTGCVNLDGNLGQFMKDGYNFLEYNSEPDGSGQGYNAGGIVRMPDDGKLYVYAIWEKWSPIDDFETEFNDDGVVITNYSADADTVSIPSKINGCDVVGIKRGAFVSKSFTTLVIPRTVVAIETEAFNGCYNLDTLYINDSLYDVSDDSFFDCGRFSKLILNAATPPFTVTGYIVATRMKILMANQELDKPIMMLVGGSSTYYGYISTYLEELLDHKYFVLNCGTNAGMCGFLFMEGLSPYLREGDVIVNAPEYGNVQFGTFDITWRTILATESCYNIYRNVDFSKYSGLFSSLSYYNNSFKAEGYRAKDYQAENKSMTYPNCDMAGIREYKGDVYPGVGFSEEHLTDTRINNFNWMNRYLSELGINYWMSCAPVYELEAPSDTELNNYYLMTKELLDCVVISNPKNHVYAKELYYDQQYHHTTEGAMERTKRVADDIINYLSTLS